METSNTSYLVTSKTIMKVQPPSPPFSSDPDHRSPITDHRSYLHLLNRRCQLQHNNNKTDPSITDFSLGSVQTSSCAMYEPGLAVFINKLYNNTFRVGDGSLSPAFMKWETSDIQISQSLAVIALGSKKSFD